ncbi:MAG TPA: hypothetical protein DHW69_04970 [Parabacteroides distasonis]|nr:hypothetical protein [Parabacteroides distasonis]HCK56867.1 hypothetical protein [Parabacteroides distasonis]
MGIQKAIMALVLTMIFSITCQSQIIEKNMVEKVFEYGALAPSSHNAQMWHIVKEKENLYRVEIDSLWRLKAVDPHDREAYISIGCFLQNCIYAAPHCGVSMEVSVKDTKAYLTFSKCDEEKKTSEYSLYDIERRCTCRRNFLNKPISDDIVQKLSSFENVRYIDKMTDKGRELSDLIVNSNSIQLSSKKSMEELSLFISSNKNDIKRGRGLTLESLGLNSIERFFFRMFYAKKNFAGNKSFFSSSIRATKKQVENCSGFFVLFVQKDSPEELIKAGMDLERFWLKLNTMGISVHPMSQPLEEVPDKVVYIFPNSGIPEMILRVGYCKDEHSSRKLRKKIEIYTD